MPFDLYLPFFIQISSDAIVTLHKENLQPAGRFRCEVSGEVPPFQTVTEHSDMIVICWYLEGFLATFRY